MSDNKKQSTAKKVSVPTAEFTLLAPVTFSKGKKGAGEKVRLTKENADSFLAKGRISRA